MIGPLPPKVARTSRNRGGNTFVERKSNAWAARVGFMAGRGYSSVAIADSLADGTVSATIRALITRRWFLKPPSKPGEKVGIVVPVNRKGWAGIEKRAAEHGLEPAEYCRRILVHGSMPRDRYNELMKAP